MDLPGITEELVVHSLNTDPVAKPVKQKKQSFRVERSQRIKEEGDKFLTAQSIHLVQYLEWLVNMVMTPKHGGKWHLYVDFIDLSRACPNDLFPFPRVDLLVDSILGCQKLSFINIYQGYNQISFVLTDCTIMQHLKPRVGTAKGAWVDDFPSTLQVYRTTARAPIEESPYSLAYNKEAIALEKVGAGSWSVSWYDQHSSNLGLRKQLDLVEEPKETSATYSGTYKGRMAKAYNTHIQLGSFQMGDLLMGRFDTTHPVDKLNPTWEGLYKVTGIMDAGHITYSI